MARNILVTEHRNITNEGQKLKQYWKARQKIIQHNLFRKYRGQKIPFFTAYLKARSDASEIILNEMDRGIYGR